MSVAPGLARAAVALPLLLCRARAVLAFLALRLLRLLRLLLLRLLRLLALWVCSGCRLLALLCALVHSLQPLPLLRCLLLCLPILLLPLRLRDNFKLVEIDARAHLQARRGGGTQRGSRVGGSGAAQLRRPAGLQAAERSGLPPVLPSPARHRCPALPAAPLE